MERRLAGNSTIQLLAWLAISSVALHALAMVLLHWLVPEVNPLSEMVSAYLSSKYEWLSRITFVALAGAFGTLGLGLALGQIQGRTFTVGVVLTVIATIGFLGVAALPGAARLFAMPTQPATVVAVFLLSLALSRQPAWQTTGSYLLVISFGLIALFLVTIVLRGLVSVGLGGLANRIVLALIYSWVLLVARGLIIHGRAGA